MICLSVLVGMVVMLLSLRVGSCLIMIGCLFLICLMWWSFRSCVSRFRVVRLLVWCGWSCSICGRLRVRIIIMFWVGVRFIFCLVMSFMYICFILRICVFSCLLWLCVRVVSLIMRVCMILFVIW